MFVLLLSLSSIYNHILEHHTAVLPFVISTWTNNTQENVLVSRMLTTVTCNPTIKILPKHTYHYLASRRYRSQLCLSHAIMVHSISCQVIYCSVLHKHQILWGDGELQWKVQYIYCHQFRHPEEDYTSIKSIMIQYCTLKTWSFEVWQSEHENYNRLQNYIYNKTKMNIPGIIKIFFRKIKTLFHIQEKSRKEIFLWSALQLFIEVNVAHTYIINTPDTNIKHSK